MRRREFITLPGAKRTWPVAGRARPLERARILGLLTDGQNAWSSSVTKIAGPPRRRDRVRGRECQQLVQSLELDGRLYGTFHRLSRGIGLAHQK